jgi:cytochrome c-type biogenesis protein CcsB
MKMSLDEVLIALALACYVLAALALLAYFFSRDEWLRNFGAPLAIAGCALQFAQLVARYELTHIWPLLNLYGSLSLFTAMSVAIYVAFAFRYDLWFAGGFVLALAAVFLAYGVTWNEGTMPPVPSLQSYWAKIHVPLVVSSYAAFVTSFVVSCIYLLKHYAEQWFERPPGMRTALAAGTGVGLPGALLRRSQEVAGGAEYDRGGARDETAAVRLDTPAIAQAAAAGNPVAGWLGALPSLARLDVITYRAIAVGLPLLSLGIITGAMWAKESWGAYWQWDPKETAALFSWIIYLAYMHLHTRHAWRGLRTSWVSVIGFVSIIFCYLGVNIWISGLHSYKV